MLPTSYYFIAAIGMVSYLVLTWFLVDLLKLPSSTVWIARILISALGLLAGGLLLWWKARRGATASGGAGAPLPSQSEEMDPLFRDAEARLAASTLGHDAKVGTLPVILGIGDTGSAKTSTFVNCGAEPELIGGHVYQEGYIVPTRSVNLWFARNAVMVEAGGQVYSDGNRWNALLQRLRAGRLHSLFARKQQAPRSAVVFFDAEAFLKPGAQENATIVARRLNARLGEVSRALGVQLPVYVIFTRCDRIPFFAEFVGNFSEDEARQVVGATVPLAINARAGVYAEEEIGRLTSAFHDIFLGLADQRPAQLAREANAQRLPGVYEFPREFRKIRALAVQFMVDLCRPSQLQTSPYLRGFYFSGVRPVEVREVVQSPRMQEGAAHSSGATGIFGLHGEKDNPAEQPRQSVQTRRVPQWVFLSRLFNEVILRDQAAFQTSAQSVGSNSTRRLLLAAAAGLALILGIGWTTSYFANRGLQNQVSEAVSGIGTVSGGGQELAPLDALKRLDSLRENAEMLSRYSREGAPWHMRWGLYTGDDLLPTVRRLYFSRFSQLMFGGTQAALLDHLRRLPSSPGPTDEYSYTYDTLKAYLVTTSHHDKSTKLFLSPLLLKRWAGDRTVDADRRLLAQKQFDFYSDELKFANPFSSENDTLAIERARKFLAQFAATERIYQFMLAEASRRNPAANYNRQYAGSAQVILNGKDVAGAFTREGWVFMQDAIRNFERFFAGEEWVLGSQTSAALDRAKIEPELLARYQSDFIGNWREYLKNSTVLRYASVEDAARKLGLMSNNTSYLLALFCLASVNTSAATNPDVKSAFQPVQFVTPPACPDRYIDAANQNYMNSLVALQASLEQVVRARNPNDPSVGATLQDASRAKTAARQVAQSFRIDKEGHVEQMVQKLMEDPITYVEALLGRLGPGQINAEASRFCADFRGVVNKYPFNTASQTDASLEEINTVFRPGSGSLWMFYEQTLKKHMVRQGSQFVSGGGDSNIRMTPAFLRFFNRAAAFSDALYRGGGSQDPQLSYTLKSLPAEGIQSLSLTLDGQSLKSTSAGGQQSSFQWPGLRAREARLAGSLGGTELGFLSYNGLWAVFRFFGDADKWQASGSGYNFEWVPRQGQSGQPMTLSTGKPLTVRYFLDMGTTAPIFQKNYLSGFQCVSQAAQ
ncbi:ImcF-related family protein [uncultured Paludibaculum sp.]|uniref:ImcF-related family protein n=1 Tax=uncultured Paludibaculum sp. TaxID=1765020 RepID=UPI002AAACD17|nr:ImcF-related family protein [uncultured Paludibaculum sp.]